MSIKSLEVKGGAGKQDGGEEGLEQEDGPLSAPRSERQVIWEHSSEPRRISVLPLWWRITHSSRWIAQVLASELSLLAFILLLVMVFSEKWLCLSRSRFYQRWPPSVSTRIYTSAHVMSLGLLRICRSKNCSSSENGRGETLGGPGPTPGLQPAVVAPPAPCGLVPSFWSPPGLSPCKMASLAETTKDGFSFPHPSWPERHARPDTPMEGTSARDKLGAQSAAVTMIQAAQ